MLKLNSSTQFKKDYKTCMKRHYNMDLLQAVIDVLRVPDTLPQKNRDHNLTGNYTGCRECHIQPDWLLIYRQTDTELYLVATGTHSDLFGLFCKGEMKPSTTIHTVQLKNCVVVIKNVPCLKCEQCGEVVLSADTVEKIEHILQTVEKAVAEITVVNFPDCAA